MDGGVMKRVLIVIDMQNDFIDGSLGTKEAQAIVSGVTEKIQTYDGEVIYTMDTHKEDYLETVEGKKLPVIHCIKGTNGWNIQKNIMEAIQYKSNQCFEKDTFGSIQLAQLMKEYYEHGLKEVELCGVCTDICVIWHGKFRCRCFTRGSI